MFKPINSKFSTPFGFRNATSSGRILLKKMNICVFMTMIIAPCFHESLASESIQKHAELVNSGFVDNKIPLKNIESVYFSISQVGQSAVERGTKSRSSVGLTNLEIVTPNKIGPDTAKNKSSDESFDAQLAMLLGFVFAVLIPMFSSANEQVKYNCY